MSAPERDPIFVTRDLQMLLEDQYLDDLRAQHSEYTPEETDYLLDEYRKTFINFGRPAVDGAS
jgi:hypothetical protein